MSMRSFFACAQNRGLALLALPLALAGAVRADEVTDWHEHMLVALRNAGVSPQVGSRDAALVSAAVFDAVNGIERRYEPIHVPAAAPRGASKRAAAVQAAYVVLLDSVPGPSGRPERQAGRIAGCHWGWGAIHAARRGVGTTSSPMPFSLWRSTDGFTPAPPPYLGGNEVGRWRPTPPAFLSGRVPQFATMTPWGILSPDQFRPAGPPALSSQQYLLDFNETKLMGSVTSPLRTADQTDACRFWESQGPTLFWDRAALVSPRTADLSCRTMPACSRR